MQTPQKSILVYFGGKTKAITLLNKLLPRNTKKICSPFFGGGAFEIYCANQRQIKIEASDISEPLINFWACVKSDPQRTAMVAEELRKRMNRTFFNYLVSLLCSEKHGTKVSNKYTRAAIYYALNRTAWGGKTCNGGYVSRKNDGGRLTRTSIDTLKQVDLSNINFRHRDFQDAIRTCPQDTTLFLDPPYYYEDNKYYSRKSEHSTEFPHEKLAQLLKTKNKWILCYNNCAYIRKLYRGFRMLQTRWAYGGGLGKGNSELVVVSDAIYRALVQDQLR